MTGVRNPPIGSPSKISNNFYKQFYYHDTVDNLVDKNGKPHVMKDGEGNRTKSFTAPPPSIASASRTLTIRIPATLGNAKAT